MVVLTGGRRRDDGRRTQEQRSAQTRVKLLDATVDCLVEFGYGGTTTTRVAERAGVTRGAQLHHFGSREALVIAAVQHLAARRSAEAIEQVASLAAADDPIGSFLELLWDLHDGPLFTATVELWVAARTDPELRESVAKFERVVDQSVSVAVAAFLPAGTQLERPLQGFVYTAMDALRGIMIAAFVAPDTERPRRRWERACEVLRRAADPAWFGASASTSA